MLKVMERLEIQGPYLNIIKAICSKPIAKIKLRGEILEAITLKLGIRQECTLHISIQYSTQTASENNKTTQRNQQTGKEEIKVSLFADNMIVYIRDPQNSTRQLLQLINPFSKMPRYKINSSKSVAFLYTSDKQAEKEIRDKTPLQ